MRDVFVAGAWVTAFGRYPDRPLRSLAQEAVSGVLADAGASPHDVDAVFFANTAEGALNDQHSIRGQVALQQTGLLGKPIANVENACASRLHRSASRPRRDRVGRSRDRSCDRRREALPPGQDQDLRDLQAAGWDVERFGRPDPSATHSGFMDVYAAMASAYMERSGATVEDFAAISVKSHRNGALNPNAQYRDPLTVEQVLGSRTISGPLTLLMCSPIGDGAAALVLASREGLAKIGAAPEVRVLSTVLRSGSRLEINGAGGAVADASAAAYEQAGVGPGDIEWSRSTTRQRPAS